MKLNKNMGTVDRVIRVVLAILFGYLYFSGIVSGVLGIILLVLGIVFTAAGIANQGSSPAWCPFAHSIRSSISGQIIKKPERNGIEYLQRYL